MYKNGQTDGKRNRHKRSTVVHLKYPPLFVGNTCPPDTMYLY